MLEFQSWGDERKFRLRLTQWRHPHKNNFIKENFARRGKKVLEEGRKLAIFSVKNFKIRGLHHRPFLL